MVILYFAPPAVLNGGFQMKISGGHQISSLDAYVKNVRDRGRFRSLATMESGAGISQDAVVLSPEARQIQEAKVLAASLPDIREEKVAEIRARIDAGTYQIDGEKIAAKMIEESLLNEVL
jgi:negative regulator of flagellin synthesis FlgM